MIRLSYAPMEGVTDAAYRRLHAEIFPAADLYYTPFYSAIPEGLIPKAKHPLPSAAGAPPTVPQLMTARAPDFLAAAQQVAALGYTAVNLNCGCPSGTVTAKHKGAGILAYPDELDRLLDGIFEGVAKQGISLAVSVKTRIGFSSEDEAMPLLSIYNRYPISELIVHPRLRTDLYRGKPRMGVFSAFVEGAGIPLCYNGDIFLPSDYFALVAAYPTIRHFMIGRGAVANPAIFAACRGTPLTEEATKTAMRTLHDRLLAECEARIGRGRHLLCRMLEFWNYQLSVFEGGLSFGKRLRHAATLAEYKALVAELFREHPLMSDGGYIPPELR